jgi:hypothetical protein
MNTYGEVEVSGQLHAPAALPPGTHSISRVGPRTSLEDTEKRKFFPLTGLELWHLNYSARSQLLYQLRYP